MPVCCAVMHAARRPGDEILSSPPSGRGASLLIRYRLPRAEKPKVALRSMRVPSTEGGVRRVASQDSVSPERADVALVSCAKKKRLVPVAARDLYISTLFKGMRAYVEVHADGWYILSAKHGVVHPDQVIAPYDLTLRRMSQAERQAWGDRVRNQLQTIVRAGTRVMILAGEQYRKPIESFLSQRGHSLLVPMRGLDLFQQLRWLKTQNRDNDRD
jgi:hypothetical protein